MLDWLTSLGQKADHPMHSVAEAQRLLSDLPGSPLQALDEIASWLTTIVSADGFQWPTRLQVVRLLDDAGRPLAAELTARLLTTAEIKNFERLQLWQATLDFWQRLGGAYRLCVDEMQRDSSHARARRDELPLVVLRTQRALAAEAKVLYLRYLPGRENIWQSQFELYQLSETLQCDHRPLKPYADEVFPTTARQELLRTLMLNAASPQAMPAHRIELAARVTARLANFFTFKTVPEPGCYWYIDLAQPGRPERLSDAPLTASATVRFIGTHHVNAHIDEMVRQLVADPGMTDKRFGEEYSALEKIAILKYLARRWGDNPPQRRERRQSVKAEIEVALGFEAACSVLPTVDPGPTDRINVHLDRVNLDLGGETAQIVLDRWQEQDATAWGVGVHVSRTSEARTTIGALCAIKCEGLEWWIAVVRWLNHDNPKVLHAGLEVLAKKPVLAWVHVTAASDKAAQLSTADEAFEKNYLKALFLNEASPSASGLELLIARSASARGTIYEVVTAEVERRLKIEDLIEQGEDFSRVRYRWL